MSIYNSIYNANVFSSFKERSDEDEGKVNKTHACWLCQNKKKTDIHTREKDSLISRHRKECSEVNCCFDCAFVHQHAGRHQPFRRTTSKRFYRARSMIKVIF